MDKGKKAGAPRRPPLALTVACDVCRAAVGVRCAEAVVGQRVKKQTKQEERDGMPPKMVPIYALVNQRCKTARSAKARAAKKTEEEAQQSLYQRAMDLEDAFGLRDAGL